MNLTNKSEVKNLLKQHDAKPEKYLGQHFILSKNALKKMVEAAEIKKTDTIIEIGPGLGTLTQELAKTGAKITAIEKDSLMIEILKETLMEYKSVKVIKADARQLLIPKISSLGDKSGISGEKNGYKIVANLPYNAATFLIRKWLETSLSIGELPELMVLTIQKEVACRIVAKPPNTNLLGISVQFYADAEIIDYIKKESFWPKPKVDAAIIKIAPRTKPSAINRETFLKTLKAGFSHPRKQLIGNLSRKLKIPREKLIEIFQNSNIARAARAENLGLNDWQKLASNLSTNK